MTAVLPFLRWAGGKRWIAPRLAPLIQEVLEGRFLEPFLGSGAMFFSVHPEEAVLADLNENLIEVYEQVARHSSAIERELASLPVNSETYYNIRNSRPLSACERATRFIYLNRTCFGGLHRTNRKGEFNVPYGGGSRTPEPVHRDHMLISAAKLLQRHTVKLVATDFEQVLKQAGPGDVVFCDPTYRSAGRGRFDRYGPVIFSWDDQLRLAKSADEAYRRGAVTIVMNIDDQDVVQLYASSILARVTKTKSIGNRPKGSDRHREIIAILDPMHRLAIWEKIGGIPADVWTRLVDRREHLSV